MAKIVDPQSISIGDSVIIDDFVVWAALGIILVLLATVFYGFSANIAVPLQQANGSLPVVLRAQTVAAVATLPYALFGMSDSSVEAGG